MTSILLVACRSKKQNKRHRQSQKEQLNKNAREFIPSQVQQKHTSFNET